MRGKESFMSEIEPILEYYADDLGEPLSNILSEEAYDFWVNTLAEKKSRPLFTENGGKVLKYMQENRELYHNFFKASDIAQGLGCSTRTASGSMKSLISSRLVEKIDANPSRYFLTRKGLNFSFDEATT